MSVNMASDGGIFRRQLQLLAEDTECAAIFEKFLKQDNWEPKEWEQLLRTAGQTLLNPKFTHYIGMCLRPWLLELLGRAQFAAAKSENTPGGRDLHVALCMAISKLISISSDVKRFALKYFQKYPAPFEKMEKEPAEPFAKKKKLQNVYQASDRDIIETTYNLVIHMGEDLMHVWKWSDLLPYMDQGDTEMRWYACTSVAILSKMSEVEREELLHKYVQEEDCVRLSIKHGVLESPPLRTILKEEEFIQSSPALRHIAIVGGVSLPIFNKKNVIPGHMVCVPSAERNLEALALCVSQGHPALIEGVVGSGKTSVVEHLAAITGRSKPPFLTKVQLGDQTDSKTLLGTYCCTQIPGEFVWRPGSLTQAVTKGYWLLLEDLDYAPMDVISILVPLLESRILPVPGSGNVRAHPAFQLFATRRTSGGSRMVSGCSKLLDKLWTKVTLETLSRTELVRLISEKWPELTSIADRLTATYLMLSASQHDDDVIEEHQSDIPNMAVVKLSGRLVSTRDLMKWCSRVHSHIQSMEISLSTKSFQEALDCFCAAVPVLNTRYTFAVQIGSFMNCAKAEVEYYCTKYKPEVSHTPTSVKIGQRGDLPKKPVSVLSRGREQEVTFSFTRPASCLLERIAVAVSNHEPVLLVGETGTGKTSTVQYLAHQTNHKLHVINMNQQSDSTDLLGGFKPVEIKTIVFPLRQEFEELFACTFSTSKNNTFLQHIMVCFLSHRWKDLFALMEHTEEKAVEKLKLDNDENSHHDGQSSIQNSYELLNRWKKLRIKIGNMKEQVQQTQSALAFSFIEGALVKAVREGEWVLLDEINLASAETLECLSGLLESNLGSVVLLERGDNKPIVRHPGFCLFACMNPATDVGKKELPAGLRNRFTEFYVDELEDNLDLMILINDYLVKMGPSSRQINGIKDFYKKVKKKAIMSLTDGTGHKPHFSLRTLCRALSVASRNPCTSMSRSLFEAFCLSFLTQLDRTSHPAVVSLIKMHVMGIDDLDATKKKSLPLDPIPPPRKAKAIQVEGYWIPQGDCEPNANQNYIITETVRKNLHDLVRIVSIGRFPVLLQGETSVGKTSLITYLARLTGNNCVRINNHEHTDLQEYVGFYAPDENGKLVFKEGILVKAMRKGHWIILDELNLAPTDVLEALNRLLDDNRELFIPETQETVKAHKHFMLFATQNPPGMYGGRKVLSRAFRNRFVELHFDEIPPTELEMILHERCEVPLSYSKKMVAVLQELQKMRRGTNLFQGKQSFITLRDLFRWAERYRLAPKQEEKFYDWDQHLADEGYLVLAGRVRAEEECEEIRKVIEKRMKKKVVKKNLFSLSENTSSVTRPFLEKMSTIGDFKHVVWTQDMRRLYVLVAKALYFNEPVLLIGETGCGKTTVCQMIAAQNEQELYTVNCHMHTEGADFLGGLRPVRSHDDDRLFEWVDGPLILSMRNGDMFLADEISLADDSVLERLNSVLEPDRMLVLAEKGTDDFGNDSSPEIIFAEERFHLIGTMNPGGDYGKKELSPALRNRFTEIWCPKVDIERVSADVVDIIEHNVRKGLVLNSEEKNSGFGKAMLQFLGHFTKTDLGKKCVISIRDIVSWVYFINKITAEPINLDPGLAYVHGACLVLLDGLGSGLTGSNSLGWKQLREAGLNYLCQQVLQKTGLNPDRKTLLEKFVRDLKFINNNIHFGIAPFVISSGPLKDNKSSTFSFEAPRTCINLLRLLRGLQLPRPLLLEGSPGVGKTSLVMALAKAAGHDIVRINLSEQTDVSDLFGADLPMEGGKRGQFAWHDGPLLQALRRGSWIVLDELNLASQSVLEGLNACFDHRGEVYVPELGRVFQVEHRTTKIFACQNPQHQGGARKGLPKSFLNRFTQVHVEPLSSSDLKFILQAMYANVSKDILSKMVEFNEILSRELLTEGIWGQKGGPWELNLRDLFRWCDVMLKHQLHGRYNPGEYVGLIYSDRMRTIEDKENVYKVYNQVFGDAFPFYKSVGRFNITDTKIQVGHSFLERKANGCDSEEDSSGDLYIMHHQLPILESLITCINMNWMALLVGDSGVGKTSIVKLLACLANRRLLTFTVSSDMDVTELLGGFQQVDFGRELGEAVNETGICVWSAVRDLILSGNKDRAIKVLAMWHNLLTVRNDKSIRTTPEDLAHFKRQCEMLLKLLAVITPCKPFVKVDSSEKRKNGNQAAIVNGDNEESQNLPVQKVRDFVHHLQMRVNTSGGISGGGTFQWVDSLLVKAVQNGDWLLIDGVNVCSASVLDRLNAMLEPGGVLAISERGVVDGAVPSVKPHPSFRLLLAMDPQYGEISRAMRNRGTEISPQGSWSVSIDLCSILIKSGLLVPSFQNALVVSHRAVTEELPVYEQFGISSLMKAASVASHLMQVGYSRDVALTKAAMLVYVRSQGKSEVREALSVVIKNVTSTLKNHAVFQWPNFENQILSIRGLRNGSNVVRSKMLGSLLHTFFISVTCPEASLHWASSALPPPFAMTSNPEGIVQCLVLLLSALPFQEWPLLNAWLKHTHEQLSQDAISLSKMASAAIEHVCQTGLCKASKTLLGILKENHCIDPRHNMQALVAEVETCSVTIESLANKSSVWIWRTLFQFCRRSISCTSNAVSKKMKKKMKEIGNFNSMTVFEGSRAVSCGIVSRSAISHDSMLYLYPVLEKLHEMVLKIGDNTRFSLSNKEWDNFCSAVRWTDRLYGLCNQIIRKEEFHLFLPQLALHWQWIVDGLLNKLPVSWNEVISPELQKLMTSMKSVLIKEFGPLDRLGVDLRKYSSPAPFTSLIPAEAQRQLIELSSLLSPTPYNHRVNLFLASLEGRAICSTLLQMSAEVEGLTLESVSAFNEKLAVIEQKLNKKCLNSSLPLDGVKANVLAHYIQLWPLLDYISLNILQSTRTKTAVTSHVQDALTKAPGIYKEFVNCFSGPSFRQNLVASVHSYLAFRRSTSFVNTNLYLNYSFETLDEDTEEQVKSLKEVFIHPSSCQLTYILTASSSHINNSFGGIIEEVVAGVHVEKIGQLKSIRSTLWNNWSALSNPELTYEASFAKAAISYITSTLCHLSKAVGIAHECSIESSDAEKASELASEISSADSALLASHRNTLLVISKKALELSKSSADYTDRAIICAEVILHLSCVLSDVLRRLEAVDPAKKTSLLLCYYQEEKEDLEIHLNIAAWLDHLRGSVQNIPHYLSHPHFPILRNRCNVLQTEIDQLRAQIAFRPDPPEYHQLIQDIEYFSSTVFTPDKIQELISGLKSVKELPDISLDTKGKVERMLHTCDSFVENTIKRYPLYRDITYPLLKVVTSMCEALHFMKTYSALAEVCLMCGFNIADSLSRYSSFPTHRKPSDPLVFLSERSNIVKASMRLLPEEKHPGQMCLVSNFMIRSAVLDLVNVVHPHNYFTNSVIQLTTDLFGEIVSIWQQQQEAKATKAQEEENLYKYKSQTLAASETEEETEERTFQEFFPAYYHEFTDLDGPDLIENKTDEKEQSIKEDTPPGSVTDQHIYETSEWHKVMFVSQANTVWLSASNTKLQVPSQLISAAVMRFNVLKILIAKAGPIANNYLDKATLGAHILSNHTSCAVLTDEQIPSVLEPVYDIYKDPNPQAALKIRPLLQPLHERVNELFSMWPDHPSLKLINVVIMRVLDFPLTSPLMRYVIGLETILEKSQEWEKNAHSQVSLMEYLQAVTRQIIEWRKMELNAWRSCLDTVTQKVSVEGRKWWPHLFDMVNSGLAQTVDVNEIITTLKKYFETSLLGDFQTRLDLVYSFHCHLTVLNESKIRSKLLALTWNFYHYYIQFLPLVTSTLAKARAPIEKDVKSYVKIARWNDINFFSVRESVTKSQRILHRHMRNWEKKLRSPVAPLLCDANSDLNQENAGVWDRDSGSSEPAEIKIKLPKIPDKVEGFTALEKKIILGKLTSFTNRCHALTLQILNKLPYSCNIISVENFIANIISNYQELQAAGTRAENNADKDSKLQQLRNVMQRRRDALAHLFKYLTTQGVSYTRGNTLWLESDIDKCFRIMPVDMNVAHHKVPSVKAAIKPWSGCVKYWNRCIGRQSLLLTTLDQAHKDLKPELIKRLRGISCHLFLLAYGQQNTLAVSSECTRELRLMIDDIQNVDVHPPSSSSLLLCWESLHTYMTSLNLLLTEISILLETVSISSPLISIQEYPEVPEERHVEEAKLMITETVKTLPVFIRKYSDYTKHFEGGSRLVTPVCIKRLRGAVRKASEDTLKVKKVIDILSINNSEKFPLTAPLVHWVNEWQLKEVELNEFLESCSPQEDESENQQLTFGETENASRLESCLACILLAVENVYKRHLIFTDKENDNEEDFDKHMISKGLIEYLESDRRDLNLRQVVFELGKLLKDSVKEPELLKMLKACVPLLEQYLAISEAVLVYTVTSHRSVTKLTSVLLAIFQNLALKGFCSPKELETEAGNEGTKNSEESKGMGLGEGEGKKDMSDQLESEDQLESALQEGESEDPGDKDLPEEDKGVEMSGDFDGKLQDVDREENNDDSDEEEEDDHEKQMGDTEKGAEQLDKKVWGDEENEGDEEEDEEHLEEEDGDGEGEQMDSRMVAKDDNRSKKEKDKEQKQKEKLEEMEDSRKENKMDDDGVEYDDNFTDQYGGEDNAQDNETEESMELDDDMILDDNDKDGIDDEEENEGDPFEIPEMGVFPPEEREPNDKVEEDEQQASEEEMSKTEDDSGQQNKADDKEVEEDDTNPEEDEESSNKRNDNRKEGTEEVNDEAEKIQEEEEMAEASADKESKSKEAEAAQMDTAEGSKDETKETPKTETGGQREENEEDQQDEQGQMGQETEDKDGVGESESKTREESHKGDSSSLVTKSSASDQADMEKPRKPGETDENRTLGDNEKSIQHGLLTREKHSSDNNDGKENEDKEKDEGEEGRDPESHSRYEHVSKADDHMDAQMVDAGTTEQAQEAPAPADRQDEEKKEEGEMLETPMEVEEEEYTKADKEKEALGQQGENNEDREREKNGEQIQGEGDLLMDTEGNVVLEATVQRPPETFFHTLLHQDDEDADMAQFDENIEGTRRQIEVCKGQNVEEYSSTWSQQEALVAPMALQLCEQLRLILEPTQASRLKGDYRTGKRLNMRKVIPYIASEFRKDKIWLRRTQPSKRTYQILLAVDDSESMVDVSAGSLAIESIALVTRALTLLEAGEVGVISFGASTRILHPLGQPFNETAGSQVLSNLKFDQQVTDFARLLEDSVALLTCSRQSSSHGNPDIAQLLLILSDGQTHTRSKAVKAAVRAARANRIFIVFLVLDAKDNKYSFYDVLVYNDGKMTNLVDSFPFPFFLVVRDINTLPEALCTALRQWFELVTADATQ
ncbi:AAA ATPase midasin [Halocaridina rubra]|uniref:Midasin n=1 Tax=Halocaridina rubra TaxID=373956 RepID=A0AAN8XGB9_HALRR